MSAPVFCASVFYPGRASSVGRRGLVLTVGRLGFGEGGGPAGEEFEGFVGGGARFGAEGGEGQAGIGGQGNGFEGKADLADGGMAEVLDAGVVEADVVRCPQGAELLASGSEFADQVGQGPVVWVAAGFGAEERDSGVGGFGPVGVEVVGAGVEEAEARQVDRVGRVVEDGEYRAWPSWLAATMSRRPLRT